jgi:hypothetical protein
MEGLMAVAIDAAVFTATGVVLAPQADAAAAPVYHPTRFQHPTRLQDVVVLDTAHVRETREGSVA